VLCATLALLIEIVRRCFLEKNIIYSTYILGSVVNLKLCLAECFYRGFGIS
jgi:hypothetical protein